LCTTIVPDIEEVAVQAAVTVLKSQFKCQLVEFEHGVERGQLRLEIAPTMPRHFA
jgi:hypothetical protein